MEGRHAAWRPLAAVQTSLTQRLEVFVGFPPHNAPHNAPPLAPPIHWDELTITDRLEFNEMTSWVPPKREAEALLDPCGAANAPPPFLEREGGEREGTVKVLGLEWNATTALGGLLGLFARTRVAGGVTGCGCEERVRAGLGGRGVGGVGGEEAARTGMAAGAVVAIVVSVLACLCCGVLCCAMRWVRKRKGYRWAKVNDDGILELTPGTNGAR